MIFIKKPITPLLSLAIVLAMSLMVFSTATADAEKAKEHFNAGLNSEKAGDAAAAIASYEAAIAEDAAFVDAYNNLGALQFREKNYEQAVQAFKSATEKDPQNADSFANLGRVQYAMKRYAESEISLKKAIDLKPDQPDYYKELGKVYYKKQNYPEVISTFSTCHQQGGGDYLTYYYLGRAYEKDNKAADAVAALKKSIDLKSSYNAHSALGSIYLGQEKYRTAAASFRNAMQADPKNYRAAFNYAVAVESDNPDDFDTNIANWQNFIKVARKNPKAKSKVGEAEEHVKQLQEAKEKSSLQ